MSFASEKIKQVKADLIGFIKFETELINKAVNGDERDIYTEEGDWKWNPAVEVPVDNSYLDVEDNTIEIRKVVGVYIGEEPFIKTEEGDEIYLKNLAVEELGAICDCLNESYISLTKN